MESTMQIVNIRKEYTQGGLLEAEIDADPIRQFQTWFEQALAAQVPEPNAMTLATATADGQPAARIVLLKAFDAAGFTFYTNYDSRKGRELAANPRGAPILLGGTSTAGAHRRHGRARLGNRVRRVFP